MPVGPCVADSMTARPWKSSVMGVLSTAGGVVFMSNGGGIEALEATTGKPLWHSQIGALTAPPETFMLDGKQHVAAYVSGGLFMFVLN